jgi:hypothetical protein
MQERTKIKRFEELERLADAELGDISEMMPTTAAFYANETPGKIDPTFRVAKLASEAENVYLSRGEGIPRHTAAAARQHGTIDAGVTDRLQTKAAAKTQQEAPHDECRNRDYHNSRGWLQRLILQTLHPQHRTSSHQHPHRAGVDCATIAGKPAQRQ